MLQDAPSSNAQGFTFKLYLCICKTIHLIPTSNVMSSMFMASCCTRYSKTIEITHLVIISDLFTSFECDIFEMIQRNFLFMKLTKILHT